MKRLPGWLGATLLVATLVLLRVVALADDTWIDLCWGSGPWTDEGYYTYNARNRILFGPAERDQFNNRILSPILDEIQRVVFTRFGVGLVPARMISVVAGLLALAFFWDGLRRRFGTRVARVGLIFLGLEASFVFYNRLALMESPATLVLCAAFWAWSFGTTVGFAMAGAIAASAIAWKTNYLLFLPLPPLLALWRSARGERDAWREVPAYTLGAVAAIAAYLVLWGLPNAAEIVRMNDFYRAKQSQPRSGTQLLWMIRRGLIGYHFGLFQRLETRLPVATTLALAGLVFLRPLARRPRTPRPRRAAELLLGAWLAAGLLFLLVSRYAPTRYYLIFYPALAGVAAVTLCRLPALLRLGRRSARARRALAAVAFPLGFHLIQPVCIVLAPIRPFQVAIGAACGALAYGVALRGLPRLRPALAPAAAMALFLAVSLGQVGVWWATRRHQTRDASAILARILKPGQRLVGDWTPELCLENRLRAIPVFVGLANDDDPVRNLRADYLLVTQTPYPIALWNGFAPQVVRPENHVETLHVGGYAIKVYRVPDAVKRGTP